MNYGRDGESVIVVTTNLALFANKGADLGLAKTAAVKWVMAPSRSPGIQHTCPHINYEMCTCHVYVRILEELVKFTVW